MQNGKCKLKGRSSNWGRGWKDGFNEHIKFDRVSNLTPCAPFPKREGGWRLYFSQISNT